MPALCGIGSLPTGDDPPLGQRLNPFSSGILATTFLLEDIAPRLTHLDGIQDSDAPRRRDPVVDPAARKARAMKGRRG